MRRGLKFKVLVILVVTAVLSLNCPQHVFALQGMSGCKLIRTFEKDTTGKKTSDTVMVLADTRNKGYIVEIKQNNGKTYLLKPASGFAYLAPYTAFWKIDIQIYDVNSDAVPEIITWGAASHENALHIFRWDGSDYRIVYSGFNTGFDFMDITGDRVLELVIDDRIYGTGDEYTYFQWQKNGYRKIYYEIYANRGFERIQGLRDLFRGLRAGEPENSGSYFESYLNAYFTAEWTGNESNRAYIRELAQNIFTFQVTKYISDKLEFDNTGKPVKDTWELEVLVYKAENSSLLPKEMLLTAVTKPVGNREYKIDYLKFYDRDSPAQY